jgi:hypothetical protein
VNGIGFVGIGNDSCSADLVSFDLVEGHLKTTLIDLWNDLLIARLLFVLPGSLLRAKSASQDADRSNTGAICMFCVDPLGFDILCDDGVGLMLFDLEGYARCMCLTLLSALVTRSR